MKWRTRRIKAVVAPIIFFVIVVMIGFTYKAAIAKNEAPEKNPAIDAVVQYLRGKKVDIQDDKLKTMADSVYKESQQYDIDYRLALAVIEAESNFNRDAVSSKGARGLFQIKPSLAKYIAKDAGVNYNGDNCLHEPEKNIKLGIYHLSRMVDTFKSLPAALHAYNVGENRLKVRTTKGEPKTAFTKKVMKEYEKNLQVLPDAEDDR
jgi:soluble lytic murein transglycosylase